MAWYNSKYFLKRPRSHDICNKFLFEKPLKYTYTPNMSMDEYLQPSKRHKTYILYML